MGGTRGERIAEHLSHIIPASLTAVRVGEIHAAGFPDGVSLNGDVKAAYVKALLEGDEVWASLPKQVLPKSHDQLKDPVVRDGSTGWSASELLQHQLQLQLQ